MAEANDLIHGRVVTCFRLALTIISNRTVIMYCVRRIFGMTGRPRGATLENNMVWDKNKLITYVE